MKLLRPCLVLLGFASLLSSCASDEPKNWGSGDPLDRYDQPRAAAEMHGSVGMDMSSDSFSRH